MIKLVDKAYEFSNGNTYEGMFDDGVMDGQGEFFIYNGNYISEV